MLPGRKRADDGLDEGLTRVRPLRAADEGLTYSRAVSRLLCVTLSPPEPPVPGLFSPLAGLVSRWYVESIEPGNRNADPGLAARDAGSCIQAAPTHAHTHIESSDRVRVWECARPLYHTYFQRQLGERPNVGALGLNLCTCHMRANATCTRVRMRALVRAHACVFLCEGPCIRHAYVCSWASVQHWHKPVWHGLPVMEVAREDRRNRSTRRRSVRV